MVTTLRRRWAVVLLVALAVVGGMLAWQASPASAATCTTSSASGGCGPYYNDPIIYQDVNGSPDVAQDMWAANGTGMTQTLTANNLHDWNVVAKVPTAADQGSVKSYPSARVTYTLTNGATPPMSNFGTALNSSWSQVNPAGSGDWEWAYDIWLNPAGQQSWGGSSGLDDQEIMIWTDVHGQVPAGSDTGKVYTDTTGVSWEIWLDKSGCSTCTADNDHIVTYVRQASASSGAVDLMGFFNNLKSNGYTTSTAGIDQINYGVEICATAGGSETFTVNGYTLTKDSTATPPPTTPPATTPPPTTPPPTPTPTPTTTSTGPTQLVLDLSWSAIANTSHYVVQWTPTGGSTVVFRPTVPSLSATVNGTSGKLTIDAIVSSGAARHVSTSNIAAQ